MYCAWRIPAHLRCTQCSILLHLMDICFLTCICLWQISQIQTFLFKVVGPGLVSTSPAFVSSSASHPAGPHGTVIIVAAIIVIVTVIIITVIVVTVIIVSVVTVVIVMHHFYIVIDVNDTFFKRIVIRFTSR